MTVAELAEEACRTCETPRACFVVRPRPCDPGGSYYRDGADLAVMDWAVREMARRISQLPPPEADRG